MKTTLRLLASALALAACGGGDGPATPQTTAPTTTATATDTTSSPPDTTTSPPDVTADPCGGVPVGGRCRGGGLEVCVVGTGSSEPFVTTYACPAGLACQESGGAAQCVVTGACADGASRCQGARLDVCEGGAWRGIACGGGCTDTVLGAACRPDLPIVAYDGTLSLEARGPDAAFADWDRASFTLPGSGFLIVSFADGQILDAVTTADDDEASFTIDVVRADAIDGDDFLAAFALRPAEGGALAYGLYDPGLEPGAYTAELALQGDPWFWTWTVADIASGDGVHIPIDAGSGAAYAFVYLRGVYDFAESFFGFRPDTSLVFWLGLGVSWDCGACFTRFPWQGDGVSAQNQIFLSADADEGYWSGAVLAHELGHWVMSSYGTSPGEGGQHILGVPSHPGLAWSEGFATWFSSAVRGESYYYDKQNGLFFWVDFAEAVYSGGGPLVRPMAQYGLEQLIDENEVARMLLALGDRVTDDALLATLAAPRMNVAPFLRGYERRTWDGLDADGWPIPFESTGQSAPHLADFLDALVCDDVAAASVVDAVTEPAQHYPYPSHDPLCRAGRLPIEVRWHDVGDEVAVEVVWHAALAAPLEVAPVARPGLARRLAADRPGATRLVWRRGAGEDDAVRVSADGPGWHIRGVARRHTPRPAAIARDGFAVDVRGRSFGRGVALTR